jgi:hypothetical protein
MYHSPGRVSNEVRGEGKEDVTKNTDISITGCYDVIQSMDESRQ